MTYRVDPVEGMPLNINSPNRVVRRGSLIFENLEEAEAFGQDTYASYMYAVVDTSEKVNASYKNGIIILEINL